MWLKVVVCCERWFNVVNSGFMWLKVVQMVLCGGNRFYVVKNGVMWLKVHCCLCLSMPFEIF